MLARGTTLSVTALSRRPEPRALVPTPSFNPDHQVLIDARASAVAKGLKYSGDVSPAAAWELFEQQAAVLLDVRTAEERKFVGHVPGSLHLPWLLGTAMQTNPRFVRELEAKIPPKACGIAAVVPVRRAFCERRNRGGARWISSRICDNRRLRG